MNDRRGDRRRERYLAMARATYDLADRSDEPAMIAARWLQLAEAISPIRYLGRGATLPYLSTFTTMQRCDGRWTDDLSRWPA